MQRFIAPPVLLILTLTLGCTHDRPLAVSLGPQVQRPDRAAVLLFADCLQLETLQALLDNGSLPNIQRRLVDRGTRVTHALSCLPSITYANTVTFLTGRYPGHHNITGNKFFDRYQLLCRDYGFIKTYQLVDQEFIAPTIYEILKDKYTVSIQCAARRGVTRTIDNWATSGINWFFGQINNVDKLTTIRFELIAEAANSTGRWPDFIHAYFPACDENAHRFGVNSPEYRAALVNLDTQIGRIFDAVDRAGMLDKTFFCLVSDHGMVPTPRENYIDVARILRDRFKLRMVDGPLDDPDYWKRFEVLDKYDAVVVNGGSRRAGIYLRYDRSWAMLPEDITQTPLYRQPGTDAPQTTATDLARCLVETPAVHLAAIRAGKDRVRILSRLGEADVERRSANDLKTYRCLVRGQADPVGYNHHPPAAALLDEQFHTADEWRTATIEIDAPDLIDQLPELFDSHRCGDIILFAAAGWDFSIRDVAGHGGILAGEMRVPMMFAGPGIPAGATVDTARTCDIMPTLVDLLGCADRLAKVGPLDGVSLVEKLHKAVVASR